MLYSDSKNPMHIIPFITDRDPKTSWRGGHTLTRIGSDIVACGGYPQLLSFRYENYDYLWILSDIEKGFVGI